MLRSLSLVLTVVCFLLILTPACSSDKKQLKASREAFISEDYEKAEAILLDPDVIKQTQNRFVHYSSLASIAMSQGLYEKAIDYLNKSRNLVNELRSSQSGFTWFSTDYKSNGIEYSYLHYFLVMAHVLLAEEVEAQGSDPRKVADLRRKARAELLAWDTHLQALKAANPNRNYYRDDIWARLLASYLHANSENSHEKRTAELLAADAQKILDHDFKRYPSAAYQKEKIHALSEKLKKHDPRFLFVVEAGVMSPYKIKRFHLGLSTLFRHIKDPTTRAMIEQIGFRVLLEFSPEFGLVLFSGALAGAGSVDEDSEFDGPPRQFSDAVDESFGFLIQFPSLELPPVDTQVVLELTNEKQKMVSSVLPVVSPLQEIISTDLKQREEHEMLPEAIKVGVRYLSILIPAIKMYKAASAEGNFFKKLAIVAGYYMSKKLIDSAHRPDLRSWNTLPKLIAADALALEPGVYQSKVIVENIQGRFEKSLGTIDLSRKQSSVIRQRIGEVSILKNPRNFETINP